MSGTEEGSGESSAPPAAPPAAAPVFGSAFTFGAGAGGGGFSAAAVSAGFAAFGAKPAKEEEDDGEEAGGDPEAECTATFKPLVQLEEVATTTGEEDEDVTFEAKAKSYRFQEEWKEKGTGPVKLLRHKVTGKVRLVQRRDKTLKICANFLVSPEVHLKDHAGSDKSVSFTTQDFSDESTGKQELFCFRFGSVEKLKAFRTAWEEAQAENAKIAAAEPRDKPAASEETAATDATKAVGGGADVEEGEEVSSKAADALADALGGVKVDEKKEEATA